jgi:DNA-binding transcriptional regulator YhcF (GntR family)
MQLWFARNGDVNLREQLVTQIVLGILCEELAPGQRLPSTRELARRFRIHPNTVSAGYRQLERERWVESRRGSGIFVRGRKPDPPTAESLGLDYMIADLLRSARKLGAPLALVRSRLRQWLDAQPPDHFLLIEPDSELRKILSAEMQRALKFPVRTTGLPDRSAEFEGAIVITIPGKEGSVRQKLPPNAELITLQIRSVPTSLAQWLPAPANVLVGVASRWGGFLKRARTMLLAAGFEPESLVVRDATRADWKRGLEETAAVVCDCLTAAELPKSCRAIPFSLLSDASIAELCRIEEFITRPIEAL